jgi:hypothetical protein
MQKIQSNNVNFCTENHAARHFVIDTVTALVDHQDVVSQHYLCVY